MRRRWLLAAGVVVLSALLLRGLVVQASVVTSGSMQPALRDGDRVLVDKVLVEQRLRRGDVVVFDATRAFALGAPADRGIAARLAGGAGWLLGSRAEQDYVKRVIGVPGDTVRCCDAQGRMVVNGTSVHEPWVKDGDVPSEVEFEVSVPAGRVWVMGDHRSSSSDSRDHLGSPGGGMVRVDDIVGRVTVTTWPLGRVGDVTDAPALRELPTRPLAVGAP